VSATPVFVLGGFQTDFARNWSREGATLAELCKQTVLGGLGAAALDPEEIEVAHVGNFAAELFCGQGHLGAFVAEADPAFVGLPTSRHEAACASGSVAMLAAMADIEAGRYHLACVVGVEMMRNVSALQAQRALAAAAWVPDEIDGIDYPWPKLFSDLGDEYERRYGLSRDHLAALAKSNFANAKRNPNAQTRAWTFEQRSFEADDEKNPTITGRIRRQDCSQITDGGAVVFLASRRFARDYAAARSLSIDKVARIKGWGHRTDRMKMSEKLAASREDRFVLPHVRGTILDAFARAGIADVFELDAIEVHDCFTTTQYMAIDHFGLTPPGQSWRAIENGAVGFEGNTPVNPSGGLIGLGHPVGASGVRMVLDAFKQVTGTAGGYQIGGAQNVATLNIGGSATTSVSFVVGCD